VIVFLVKEEIPELDIHSWLQHTYGSFCMGASRVRQWLMHFRDGNTDITNLPHIVCIWADSVERNKGKIIWLTRENRCVMVREMAAVIGMGHHLIYRTVTKIHHVGWRFFREVIHTVHIFGWHYVFLLMPLLECEISLPTVFNVALLLLKVCHLGISEHDTMFFFVLFS